MMDPVVAWLLDAGLGNHVPAFRDAKIGLAQLRDLTDEELSDLGLSPGSRIRFKRAVATRDGSTTPVR